MYFCDIHTHILAGVDDGAENDEEMFRMLDNAYADGTRILCCTPHFMPRLFNYNKDAILDRFQKVQKYAEENYPEITLFLGNELAYGEDVFDALSMNNALTLNQSNTVLVDFPYDASFYQISFGVNQLISKGYAVILAHAERYDALEKHLDWLKTLRESNGYVQCNASSLFLKKEKKRMLTLAKKRLIDVVASDGHNLSTRPITLSSALPVLAKYYDEDELYDLFWHTPKSILSHE